MNARDDIIYRVNSSDEICYANEAYDEFAAANDGETARTDAVLHRPLWDFITDRTTIRLYDDILSRVRKGHRLTVPFRCDSATARRRMELEITPAPGDMVQFCAKLLAEEPRPCESLLDPSATRTTSTIPICSWCRRIKVHGKWLEVEEGVAALGLFDVATLPRIRNGICEPCCRTIQEILDRP